MTSKRQPVNDEITIASYLKNHPDFFDRHGELLESIHLKHTTGASVSLIERQVSMLRDRNRSLKKQLGELMSIARDNDRLSAVMHELTLRLVKAPSLRGVFQSVDQHFRLHFPHERYVLMLLQQTAGTNNMPMESNNQLRFTHENEPGFEQISGLLKEGRPVCGRLSDAQYSFLFGEPNDLRSAALVPLRPMIRRNLTSTYGLICVASTDPGRFHASMGTIFLTNMGETISCAIERHSAAVQSS